MLRTDADVELETSVRRTLEGIPREQGGFLGIEELRCPGPEALPGICQRARPDLTILVEPAEGQGG